MGRGLEGSLSSRQSWALVINDIYGLHPLLLSPARAVSCSESNSYGHCTNGSLNMSALNLHICNHPVMNTSVKRVWPQNGYRWVKVSIKSTKTEKAEIFSNNHCKMIQFFLGQCHVLILSMKSIHIINLHFVVYFHWPLMIIERETTL